MVACAILLRLAMSSKLDLQLSVILCNSNSYMKKSTYLRVDHYYKSQTLLFTPLLPKFNLLTTK